MLAEYGNHPSFFAMLIGNESQAKPGRDDFSREFLTFCRESDGRHLYSDFAGTGMVADVDFAIKPFVRIGEKTELARYKEHLPGTRYDYAAAIAMMDVPLVAHEAVQQAVYPDFAEIAKYSGPLKPHAYEFVRELMKKNGLEKFEREIFMAVGKRQTLLYKSGIESLLRTPDYAGYQLLGINDFSGQGMALVGAVDSFWDVKDYTSAAEYRRFQSDMVPLARFDKYVWTADETFSADIELAHYGPRDLENQEVSWTLRDARNQTVAEGKWDVPHIVRGGLRGLGSITLPLAKLEAPAKYRLEVSLPGAGRTNHWDIWVFPASGGETVPPNVTVASTMPPALMDALRSGGKACLFVDPSKIVGTGQKFSFYGFIWNSILKGTVTDNGRGVLVKKDHPALALFPTDEFTDWQWEPLINGSKPLDLSAVLPADELPIVATLDIWRQARKLGSVFEIKLGGGKLLVCTFDLNQPAAKNPAAAQLRRSLLAYAASDAFNPTLEMTAETLNRLLYGGSGSLIASIGGRVKSVSSEAEKFPAKNLIDGKRDTIWHSGYQPEKEPLPHRIVLELPESIEIEGLNYIARQTPPVTRVTTYEVFASANGSDWGQPVKTGRLKPDDLQSEIRFSKPVPVRFIRFDITGSSNAPAASVAELDILFDPGKALNMGLIDPTGKRLDR
jgi:hypothetical protein